MFIHTTKKNNKKSLYYQLNRRSFNFKSEGKIRNKLYNIIIFLVFLVTIIFVMQELMNLDKSNGYQVIKMNSNEYKVKIGDDIIALEIFTLIENPELIRFNHDIHYYKDFIKYIDVSENTEISTKEILGRNFINIRVAEKVDKYYQIMDYEGKKAIIELDYDFDNFDNEMKELMNIIDKYPPLIKKVNMKEVDPQNYNEDYIYEQYSPNSNVVNLEKNQYEMYNWYIKELEITSYKLASKASLKGFTLFIYLDGEDIEKIGEINKIIPLYRFNVSPNEESYDNIKDIDFPVKIDNCNLNSSSKIYGKSNLYFQLYYDYATDECKNTVYKNSVIQSMIIDFANETHLLNLDDYEIEIYINDTEVSEDYFLVNGTRLYMMPIPTKYDLDMESIEIETRVLIKDKDGEIVFQFGHITNFFIPS